MIMAVASVCLGAAGCGSSAHFVGAEREFEEQDQVRREQAAARDAARRRAERIQRQIAAAPLPVAEPTSSCHLEFGPVKPRGGIIPIACGDLGERWPLKVESGFLRCEPVVKQDLKEIVFTAPDGVEYAVNIGAVGAGYRNIAPLRRKLANGSRASKLPLAERGEELCG
jgi:hypothetical protein